MVNRQYAQVGKLYVVKWREDLVIFVRWIAIRGKMNNEQHGVQDVSAMVLFMLFYVLFIKMLCINNHIEYKKK